MSISAAQPERIEYDDAPVRLFHFRVAIGASGGEFSDGFGLGIIGIALSLATPALHLTALWTGLIAGASLVGIFVLGTDYAVNKPMLIEFTPRRIRGKLLGMLSVAWAVGYACAYFVGFALQARGPDAWRWMLLSSAAPCLLVLPLRLTVPETPPWLMRHGQTERAARIVRQRLGAKVALPVCPPDALVSQHRWRQLFSPTWRQRTLLGCAFFSCLVIPYFAVGTFVSQVLSAMKLQSPYSGGLVYNLTLLAGGIAGMLVADHLSRRRFLIGSFAVAAATMLILTLWRAAPAIAVTILFAAFAGVLSAASNLVYVYLPELFPTDLRASGIGLASAVSRIGSAVSTFLLPVVVATYGIRIALAACVAVLAIGTIICQRWAPETGQLRLAELDQASAPISG